MNRAAFFAALRLVVSAFPQLMKAEKLRPEVLDRT
jgi:hypothetical protein